jgi:hypothetical protein
MSPYALVAADPLAAVADGWRLMWDVSRRQGPAGFEREAAKVLSAWRAGLFELPDYYLVTATSAGGGEPSDPGEPGPDFHLGPLRSIRPHRVAFVAVAGPGRGDRNGPWLLSRAAGRSGRAVAVARATRSAPCPVP